VGVGCMRSEGWAGPLGTVVGPEERGRGRGGS